MSTSKRVEITNYEVDVTAHKEPSSCGVTNLVEAKKVLELLRSLEIDFEGGQIKLENLKLSPISPHHLKGCVDIRIDL